MRMGHFLYTKNAPVIADALQNAAMIFNIRLNKNQMKLRVFFHLRPNCLRESG